MIDRLQKTLTAGILSVCLAPGAFGATGIVAGQVKRVLNTDNKFGNCMAFMSTMDSTLRCSNWVTFDCAGLLEGTSKQAAYAKFDLAQLGLVTQNRVRVEVNDSRKINGQCYAERIDVYPE